MWKLQAPLLLSRCCVIMVLSQHWHWDLRKFEVLQTLPGHAHSLDFSQKGLIACGTGSFIKDLNDPFGTRPYEDVVGIGHSMGWYDILIPESGEPNFGSWVAKLILQYRQRKRSQQSRREREAEKESGVEAAKEIKMKKKTKGRNKPSKKVKNKQEIIARAKRPFLEQQIKEEEMFGKKQS